MGPGHFQQACNHESTSHKSRPNIDLCFALFFFGVFSWLHGVYDQPKRALKNDVRFTQTFLMYSIGRDIIPDERNPLFKSAVCGNSPWRPWGGGRILLKKAST